MQREAWNRSAARVGQVLLISMIRINACEPALEDGTILKGCDMQGATVNEGGIAGAADRKLDLLRRAISAADRELV